jgi:hypothetical protein
VCLPLISYARDPDPNVSIGHFYRMVLSPLWGRVILNFGATLHADATDVTTAWLIILSPYALCQLTRAVVWTVKRRRAKTLPAG